MLSYYTQRSHADLALYAHTLYDLYAAIQGKDTLYGRLL